MALGPLAWIPLLEEYLLLLPIPHVLYMSIPGSGAILLDWGYCPLAPWLYLYLCLVPCLDYILKGFVSSPLYVHTPPHWLLDEYLVSCDVDTPDGSQHGPSWFYPL